MRRRGAWRSLLATTTELAHRSRIGRVAGEERSLYLAKHGVDRTGQAAELGALIKQLQQQKRQLATENAALLKRAIDAEKMVDRLNEQHAKLVGELTAARQPIVLPRRRA